MARMLPPYVDKYIKSSGERMLFNIFKDSDFSKDWIVLHSLNLSQHTRRLYGEIDFLLLIPRGGIYVVEVKGGDVKCNDGIWQFKDRFGQIYNSSIGPFNQARDAMFSLRAGIEKEFGKSHKLTRLLYGFFCAFPQVCFDKHSIEYEQWQIMDKDTIHTSLDTFFDNMIEQFINKNIKQKWFSIEESLPDRNDCLLLCDFLRGDYEQVRTTKERLYEFDNQVRSYTSEQYRILDQIQLNKRCLIQGSAGTGKTMIAMESAVRAASSGKKVFLTCFNRLIGEWMQKQLYEHADMITVISLHKYITEAFKGFDYDRKQEISQDFYSKYLPCLLREMFQKGIITKYDKLIVDEGQDLIRVEYLNLFDSMIDGGLENGNWEIYGDFERQAIYSDLSKEEMFDLLGKYSQPSRFILRINCRNTKQIGEETSLLSGFESPPFLLEFLEGIPVEYLFYNSSQHQKELITAKMKDLFSSGLQKKQLVILSTKRYESSVVSSISEFDISQIKLLNDINTNSPRYCFATVQSYKGMESNYIIIADIDDLSSDTAKSLLYVGMSRAKYGLILLISEAKHNQYCKILKEKLQNL